MASDAVDRIVASLEKQMTALEDEAITMLKKGIIKKTRHWQIQREMREIEATLKVLKRRRK